jgi:uncharacterized protein YkwD
MSRTILPCRRFCCRRTTKTRSVNIKTDHQSSISTLQENNLSSTDQLIYSDVDISLNNETISSFNQIDFDRLAKEYLNAINEYRFHLGYSSIELSNELTKRALQRANELSSQDHIENTNRFDLIYNNEPIGETYEHKINTFFN